MAHDTQVGPKGGWVDPGTGTEFLGPYHVGHRPNHENWRILEMAEEFGWNQRQLNEYVNAHPEFFQIEVPSSNVDHRFETPR